MSELDPNLRVLPLLKESQPNDTWPLFPAPGLLILRSTNHLPPHGHGGPAAPCPTSNLDEYASYSSEVPPLRRDHAQHF